MSFPWKGAAQPRDVSDEAFRKAAAGIGCEAAVLAAVWEVEASGRCFLSDGSVIRRFEPHHFPEARWPQIGFAPAGQAPWRASLALSTARRSRMFLSAYALDAEAALRASSWGGPQIMGFNVGDMGYETARALVRALATGADRHVEAFVALAEAWGLGTALRSQNWLAIARRWNGTGQPEVYAARMERAYRNQTGSASPQVLDVGDRGSAVRRLQEALGIEDDGRFGPATRAAVVEFQRENGLAQDGIVGAKTWAALKHERDAQPKAQSTVPPLIKWLLHLIEMLLHPERRTA